MNDKGMIKWQEEQIKHQLKLLDELKAENEQLKQEIESRKNSYVEAYNEYKYWKDRARKTEARLEKAIELPCKVGDVVYYVHLICDENGKEYYIKDKGIVNWFNIDMDCTWMYVRYESGLTFQHPIENIGKDVFLTKAEAEKALEKLKGNDD